MSGLHKSPFKGSSVEFAEHRQYGPGVKSGAGQSAYPPIAMNKLFSDSASVGWANTASRRIV
jgi:hypothetical protein